MSNLASPSLISRFSVLKPTILCPFCVKTALVNPGSTGTLLIYGSPSMYGITSLGSIPLNASTAFTSMLAMTLFCPATFLAHSSYCASLPETLTAFFHSLIAFSSLDYLIVDWVLSRNSWNFRRQLSPTKKYRKKKYLLIKAVYRNFINYARYFFTFLHAPFTVLR